MFLFDWFRSILQYFGLINKKCNLLIIGLDNAGKSTLLSRISNGRLVQHLPTSKVCCQELSIGKVTFKAYDTGGHIAARRVWRDYFPAIDGIVFIVDASDIDRLSEARDELIGILTEEMVSTIPVLILGNKIDILGVCRGKEQLIQDLGIHIHLSEYVYSTEQSTIRPCKLVMSSLVKQVGYREGLQWMAKQIQDRSVDIP